MKNTITYPMSYALIQEDEMDNTSSNLNVAILFYYCPTTYDDF